MVLGFVASLFIGLAIGLLGAGGGILTVPVLNSFFKMEASLATASSLFVVGITSAVASLSAARRRELALKEGLSFALPGFVSVALSRYLIVPLLPLSLSIGGVEFSQSFFLMTLFALVMLAAAFSMLMRAYSKAKRLEEQKPSANQPLRLISQGFLVGGVTGIVGAGGGFLIVPALTVLMGLPMKRAVGTSVFVIALNSFVGLASSLAAGFSFDWKVLIPVTFLSLLGMMIGQRLVGVISEEPLKKTFAWFVFTMAMFILAKETVWLFRPY